MITGPDERDADERDALLAFVAAVRAACAARIRFDEPDSIPPKVVGPVGTCERIEAALRDLDEADLAPEIEIGMTRDA